MAKRIKVGTRAATRSAVVRVNLAGPVTILGCAAQGCSEFIFEADLREPELLADVIFKPKKKSAK